MCTSCMFDSSQSPDSQTPYCRANFCARLCFPMLFTAWTTVFHVRGRSPVPLSCSSHFSTSSNIRLLSFELIFSILLKMAGSTRKYVPKYLHWLSTLWFRASSTSTGQVKSDNTLQATWMTLNESQLGYDYCIKNWNFRNGVHLMHSVQLISGWQCTLFIGNNCCVCLRYRKNLSFITA